MQLSCLRTGSQNGLPSPSQSQSPDQWQWIAIAIEARVGDFKLLDKMMSERGRPANRERSVIKVYKV